MGHPKASKHIAATEKFIEFTSRAEQHTEMAEISGYTLPNVGAYKIIDPAIAKKLISPDNSKNLFRLNGAWYVETSPDGKTNTAQLIERWNTWIVR